MAAMTAPDLFQLARMLIQSAKLLKADGDLAEARRLARRARAVSRAGWRRQDAFAV